MKRVMHVLCAGVLALFALVSCSKSEDNSGDNRGNNNGNSNGNNSKNLNIPVEAKAIIPEATLRQIRGQGMPIHEGINPPNIEGIYLLDNLRFHYSSDPHDDFQKGDGTAKYKYKFYDQKGVKVKSDYKEVRFRETAAGTGVIISGSGSKFTAFLEHSAVTLGIRNKDVYILSGEITSEGIKNLVLTLTVTEKQDTSDQIMKVGVYRIFKHEGIARRVTQY